VISASVYHIVAKDFPTEAQSPYQSQDTLKYCCLNTVKWQGCEMVPNIANIATNLCFPKLL